MSINVFKTNKQTKPPPFETQPKQTKPYHQNQNLHPAFCEITWNPKSVSKHTTISEDDNFTGISK